MSNSALDILAQDINKFLYDIDPKNDMDEWESLAMVEGAFQDGGQLLDNVKEYLQNAIKNEQHGERAANLLTRLNELLPPPVIPKNAIPVYRDYLDTANAKGETAQFNKSRELNHECAQAIDRAITENSKPGTMAGTQHIDTDKAVRSVIAEYGAERVACVLAGNVKAAEYDGRFSNASKEWAQSIDIPSNAVHHLNTHRAIVESFVNKFRKIEKEKPSLLATLEANEQKSKRQFAQAEPGKDTPKKTKGEEI
jgi:hypothetical protein